MVPNGCEYKKSGVLGVDGGDSSFSTSPFGRTQRFQRKNFRKKT